MKEDSFLVLKVVETETELDELRKIRNECKDFMTRSTKLITYEQQVKWFKSKSNDVKVYILYLVDFGVISTAIGYGLIRVENNESLVSGGLISDYRNKGYGKTLFNYLINNTNKDLDIRLEVLKSNMRAFSVYNSLGFRVVEDDGTVITMLYHNDSCV